MSGSRPVVGTAEAVHMLQNAAHATLAGLPEAQELASAALAAWRERRPLAEDAELRAKVASWLVVDDQCDDIIDHACDIFDEHVLGSPAPQGEPR